MDSSLNFEGKYKIITNRNGRRIMVIKEVLSKEERLNLDYNDFDATFVNYHSFYSINTSLIWSVLPMLKDKFWLKPTFLSTEFKNRFMNFVNIVDGTSDSPLSEIVTERIEEIEDCIEKSGVPRTKIKCHTDEDLLINTCRFCLSRGITTISNNTIKLFSKGDSKILAYLFGENHFVDVRIRFHLNLLDLGYIKESRFVERLHICPSCGSSHLIFVEACPECNSSNITNEPVIHHFRCANISPESTYLFDGKLRCPKCRHTLRHIGVDYDIPASLYSCKECNHTFATPTMRVTCNKCGRVFTPEELVNYDATEYEYTEAGIKAMISDEVRFNMTRNVFTGFSAFDMFIPTLKQVMMSTTLNKDVVVAVMRVQVPSNSKTKIETGKWNGHIQKLILKLPQCKFSINDRWIYAMEVLPSDLYNEEIQKAEDVMIQVMEVHVSGNGKKDWGVDRFVFKNGDNMQEFLDQIIIK